MVIFCDFDNAMNGPDGLNSGCPGIEFSVGNADFDVATTSDSADTGPTADHTGNGGKSSNETGSRCEQQLLRCGGSTPHHGRPQEFFQSGAKPRGLTKMAYFSARRRREREFSRFFRRFRLDLRVSDASHEGENFRVFLHGNSI